MGDKGHYEAWRLSKNSRNYDKPRVRMAPVNVEPGLVVLARGGKKNYQTTELTSGGSATGIQ